MTFTTIVMLCAISLLIYGCWLFFSHEENKPKDGFAGHVITKRPDPVKQDIAIETISSIWTKKADMKLQLKELAKLWREMPPESAPEVDRPVSFNRAEIDAFYEQRLKNKPYFSGNVKRAAIKLLELLDRYGDCPSVVQGPGEVESQMGKSAYDTLAQVPLWEHSLNVANEMLARVGDGPLIPKAIMAALGHDIGKIPVFRDKLYSTGDHSLMSVMVLNDVDGFKFIPYAEEVNNAVKLHHKTVPKEKRTYLDDKLKEADQAARRNEMAQKSTISAMDGIGGGATAAAGGPQVVSAKSPIASILNELPTSAPAPTADLTSAPPAPPAPQAPTAHASSPFDAPGSQSQKPSNAAVFDQIVSASRASRAAEESTQAPAGANQQAGTQPAKPRHDNRQDARGERRQETDGQPVKKDPFARQRQAAGLAPVPGTMPIAEPVKTETAQPAQQGKSEEAAADFFGAGGEEEKARLRPQNTGVDWFVYDDFVEEARAYINKMFGNRWFAFSMPSGIVYIQTTTVMDIIRKIGRKRQIPDIEIAETDEELRKNILFSVFTLLRREHGAIHDGLVRDGFFSAFFTVRMRDGREYKKCSYIPFNFEVFGNSLGEMEDTKHGKLLEIFEVVPYTGE